MRISILFKRYIHAKYKDGKRVEGTACYEQEYKHEGHLIHWGVESQELDTGALTNTSGIIELPDGTIEMVYPESIKFTDK